MCNYLYNKPFLNRQEIETYLRFSYLFADEKGNSLDDSKIRFTVRKEQSKDDYLQELICILDDVFTSERQISDATFLSSGVDSSLLAFGIQAKKTFSVAYEEQEFDESPLAHEVAKELQSEHHVIKIGPKEYFDAVDEAISCRESLTGDASYIALYLATKEASCYTNTICSGEGPDEMFCGYPCYSHYFNNPGEEYWLSVNTIMDVGEVPLLPDYNGDGFLKMNAFDLTKWMHGNILPNVYAAAKGAKLNIRTPYMRQDLLDFALSLPIKYKADKHMGKLLFREAASRYVGSKNAFREKRGFPVPVRKWMRQEPYRTLILDVLTDSFTKDILDFVDVDRILKSFYTDGDESVWKQIWEMYVLIRYINL